MHSRLGGSFSFDKTVQAVLKLFSDILNGYGISISNKTV
jgi:hypothetical protein